jgi:hypothetical protein
MIRDQMEVRVHIREIEQGRWEARAGTRPEVRASGASRERCLGALRRALDRSLPASKRGPYTFVVEVIPVLAGVAEAAEVMGWDKRRVVTYIDRGRFPEPVQSLASGRVWLRADVEAFAAEWWARHERRRNA